ncbi:glutaredoxin family protein [Spirochaeta dissipatitropha]
MNTKIQMQPVEGTHNGRTLEIYALSTCAFCRTAMKFLQKHDLSFSYIYLDELDPEVKRAVKADLKERFQNIPIFPILVIDDSEAVSGFNEDKWKKILSIEA